MKNPFIFLFGYTVFATNAESAAEVAEFFRRTGIVYGDFHFVGEEIRFRVSAFSEKRVFAGLSAQGVDVRAESRKGLPAIVWRYRKRWGIPVGAAVCVFMLTLSPLLLWDIRIEGADRLDEERIKEVLRQCGLAEGEFLWNINTPEIETRALIACEDIGWISINLLGSVAEVEMIEYTPPPAEDLYFSSNITAKRDGVILWIEDARGYQVKEIGEEVKAGEVIISGTYPADEEFGLPERYTAAKGRVYARTAHEFSVLVPLTYEKKEYTGREKVQKSLIFFKNEIKFFGNSRNLYPECDTIETVEYITLPGGVLLPFGIRTVRYAEYEKVTAARSEESGAALARYILRGLEKTNVREGSLLKKSESGSVTEEGYLLTFRGEYIENISVTVPREE